MNKWPVAGVIAGIALFFWGGIYHMALGVDAALIKTFKDDAATTAMLKEKVADAGFYIFPNEMDPEKLATVAKTSPRGVLIYTPAGVPFSFGSNLAAQFALDVLVGLILAWLMNMAMPGGGNTGGKVCFALGVGLVAIVATVPPWWNWYNMPVAMVAAGTLEQLVGFGLAGLVLAKLLK
jgi:hypothetical protein